MDVIAGKQQQKMRFLKCGACFVANQEPIPPLHSFLLGFALSLAGQDLGCWFRTWHWDSGEFRSSIRVVGAGGGLITCPSAGEGAAAEGEGSSCGYEISHSVKKWV